MIKVILMARDIPENEYVTKITGTVRYKLVKEVEIYGEGVKNQKIFSEGCRFLIGESSYITCIPDNKELIWSVTHAKLIEYLEGNP